MESLNKQNSSATDCRDAWKLEVKKGFEYNILRNAYELLLENSQLFWDELTIAFSNQSQIAEA